MLFLTLSFVASCKPSPSAEHARWLNDREFRREVMLSSLVDGAGAYVSLRREKYAVAEGAGVGAGWEHLPEWNPPITLVDEAKPLPLEIPSVAKIGDEQALKDLGQRAFREYPAQRAAFDPAKTNDAGAFLVKVHYNDGSTSMALTCASCHLDEKFDLGRLMVEAPIARFGESDADGAGARAGARADIERAMLRWGPGRVDVTTRDGREPANIPDLRPVRFQKHLQHSGALKQNRNDVYSLAARIETLIITAHDEGVRPPREIALGLAVYLWSLADTLPAVPPHKPAAFARTCQRCHDASGDAYAGGLVPVAEVGTDARLAMSAQRGTRAYRVPSLRGVGSRPGGRLMHDGSLTLDALLDANRASGGHMFGIAELGDDEKQAIIAWLKTL